MFMYPRLALNSDPFFLSLPMLVLQAWVTIFKLYCLELIFNTVNWMYLWFLWCTPGSINFQGVLGKLMQEYSPYPLWACSSGTFRTPLSRELAQQLRALVVLGESPCLVPSTHVSAQKPFGTPVARYSTFFWLPRHTHIHRQNTHTIK